MPYIFPNLDLYLTAVAGRWVWNGTYERYSKLSIEELMDKMNTDQRDVAEAMYNNMRGIK